VCFCQANSYTKSDTTGLRAGANNNNNNNNNNNEYNNENNNNNDNENSNDNDNDNDEYKRQSVIRRLYGPENGEVRKHVRLLEENLERSRTGFMGNPDHEVPYENHPYQRTFDDRRRRESETEHELERQLQNEQTVVEEQGVVNANTNTATTTTTNNGDGTTADATSSGSSGEDLYKPLRIKFETQALDDTRDAGNAAKIDFIKTQILPK